MAKQIHLQLNLTVSDKMFETITKELMLTEEQKKYLEAGRLIPSPGLCLWNDEIISHIKAHPDYFKLDRLIADLEENKN